MSRKTLWGVQIAGLGDPLFPITDNTRKTIYSTRAFIDPVTLPTSRYFPSLAKNIALGGRELEPLEGLCSQSTVAFTFDQLDRAQDFSQLVLGSDSIKYFWIPSGVRPGATLTGSLDAFFGTFNIVTKTGFGPPAVDSIVYLGREAMVVEALLFLGGNAWRVTPYFRGMLGTQRARHDLRDPDVFYGIAANPIRIDREVTLFQLDFDETTDPTTMTEVVRLRGVVERTKINKNLSQITISCRDLLGRLTMQELGADAWNGELKIRRGTFDATHGRVLYIMGLGVVDGPVPYAPLYADNPGTVGGTGGKAMTVEVDGHALLIWATFSSSAEVPGEPWAFFHRPESMGRVAELDGNTLDASDDIKIYTAREILVIDADNPICLCRDSAGDATDHPADIIRNILTSTGGARFFTGGPHLIGINGLYDWLELPWGLGLESDLLDHPAFDKLLTEAPTGSDDAAQRLRARSTYLGGGGPEPGLARLFAFAQAMGCYIYLTPTSLLSIRHFSDPGEGGTDHEIGPAEIRSVSRQEGLSSDITLEERPSIYRIRFEFGQKGPGGEPGSFLHAEDFGERRLQRYAYLCEEDVLSSTRIYGDPVSHSLPQRLIDQLIEVFAFRWEYLQMQLPQYEIKLTNAAPRVVAGEWISLTAPDLFDNDYSRGITDHRCLVMRDQLATFGERQTINVVDVAAMDLSTTLITPSWTVRSVASDTLFQIEAARHSSDDFSFFQVDPLAKYNLWTQQLALRSTDGPVAASAFGGGNVTLTAAWTASAVPVTPLVGDIVRVATYDNRGDWNDELGFPITWIADGNGTLGAAGDPGYFWAV